MARNKVQWGVYLEKDQIEDLKKINQETQIPVAVLIRKAIDDYLNKVDKKGVWS